jgi:phosphatidylserine decarboxylase
MNDEYGSQHSTQQELAVRGRLAPEPLPANIRSVQPGGGFCYRLELLWGRWRRWWLRRFRPGYVRRMAQCRRGSVDGAPHAILDPRDLKYCRNLCTAHWDAADDRFRWRDSIPFARWGLAELQIFGWPLAAAAVALGCTPWWYLAGVPAVLLGLVAYFFRDPPRRVPQEPGAVLAPADGRVVDITQLEHDPFVGGPAVRIGIFLSLFNVHVNRSPMQARCIRLQYTPGKYLNALNPRSSVENEAMTIGLEGEQPPHRRLVVRQISGLVARRIVCSVRPGEVLERGQKFGMIKLGSRTELILPRDKSLHILVRIGEHVRAGTSLVARFDDHTVA